MDNLTVDFDKNCQTLSISLDIYLRILSKAVNQTANDLTELDNAIERSDFEQMRYVSHRLKGDYDNLRITQISLLAKKINDLAKTEQDKEKITELFQSIKSCFSELKAILSEKNK